MKIQNAYQNNLKHIDLSLPEHQLIVVTGLSGSGKSSLAMDVIGNEGYRYFLESLPAYQQNSQSIPTAEVDEINDLPPVIKVEQTKRFQSVNTTFGTLSELSSIFRILFARYAGEEKMSKSLFSFNHPKGACEVCNGIGEEEYIDLDKLIGDEHKTLREGAIVTTLPNGYIVYSQVTVEELNKLCKTHDFNVDIPWKDLTEEQKNVVLNGSERTKVYYGKHSIESRLRWQGLKAKPREEGYYKGVLPIMSYILKTDRNPNILKFVSSRLCPSCKGARIKAEHLKFQWQGRNFDEWMTLSLEEMYAALEDKSFSTGEMALVEQLQTQLYDLIRLGMGDYHLNSPSTSISSGDAQRIKLINQVNCNLQGILYVFDEPSIGLSANYQAYLLHILQRLIRRGNTVMVVEHDLEFIQSADWIVELGPKAGIDGGEVIFNGKLSDFLQAKNIESPTLDALSQKTVNKVFKPNKLKENNFSIVPQKLTVITKKTEQLVHQIEDFCHQNELKNITVTDQAIGKTPRSNPSTYVGLADKIRDLLAKTPMAKERELKKGVFSFNNKTGRCPACEGAGVIILSMSVMGNVNQVCPTCNGQRFKPEVLQVEWKGKNIAAIYDLSIREAHEFFASEKKITKILALMMQLGLGYIKLGQPSNTLSGGEAQRIKLTKHFAKPTKNAVLLLEEPSIGLHYQNAQQLVDALHQLKENTAGIVCFENHELFQQNADALLDNEKVVTTENLVQEPQQQRNQIEITGAKTHHLKDLNLSFPKNQFSAVTGISGAGKSSLVIDTLHGYGLQEMSKQFSSYQQSRVGVNFQFEVDNITGLTPTICVTRKQKSYSLRTDIAKQTGMDKILRFVFSRKAMYEGEELSASHFSNAHELGRCPICEGVGEELLPTENLLVKDAALSISEGVFEHNKALSYYGHAGSQYMAILAEVGKENGFDLNTSFSEMNSQQKDLIFNGTGEKEWSTTWRYQTKTRTGTQDLKMPWKGVFNYLKVEYYKTRKNKNIKNLRALLTYEKCEECDGSGLLPERLSILVDGKSIDDIKSMDFVEMEKWLNKSTSVEIDQKLKQRIQGKVAATTQRAKQLHINHLQLNRKAATLSGGENQRVELIQQLNSPLKGITYLLDEPSAGLSNDNIPDLIQILQELIAKGNTVIVIEHNKEILMAAEYLVELGPKAGRNGGEVTFEGNPKELIQQADCHPFFKEETSDFQLKSSQQKIEFTDISRYSLQKRNLSIPIGGITALTGKSGVGKTTLVKEILIPSVKSGNPVHCASIDFPKKYENAHYFEIKPLRTYESTLLIDYLGLLKELTKLFGKETALKPKDFSYKTKSSQCPNCKGKGTLETSLDITSNAIEVCEMCEGQRYQSEILIHKIDGKSIADVLSLSIEALSIWLSAYKIGKKSKEVLEQLHKVGLQHLQLAQPVQSLSSGEKQRLLILNWLKENPKNELFILDEPSTGLHYKDIDLLFPLLEELSEENDVLVVEHNMYLLEKIGVGVAL
ncbi:excinuclease ABC subunit A [Brumimicrobium salinarum]|uniref:UvrABC system protein A n=1 Tax=Brumimicrobium salinarum TaxID=2058658 RepID=A0A2I0R543_9FLAO|nr:ATP-binding cassette domain-containing protein [Brumimicrobium salinarum]PKR81706.1 excinuclease ABC subunit A [Brumimicrobium salinarum]